MEVIIAIVTLIIGVLGFLSYHHYLVYVKISYGISFVTCIICLFIGFLNTYIMKINRQIDTLLSDQKFNNISEIYEIKRNVSMVVNSFEINLLYILFIPIAISIFLSILYFSPYYIPDHPYNNSKHKGTTN